MKCLKERSADLYPEQLAWTHKKKKYATREERFRIGKVSGEGVFSSQRWEPWIRLSSDSKG